MDLTEAVSAAGASALLIGCALIVAFMLGALLEGARARGYAPRRTADDSAKILLKQWLSPEQLALFERTGHFEVKGSHTGKRYRIRCARQMNIDELDAKGSPVRHWCFGPAGCLPLSDIMLAQKIALENDEQRALAIANRAGLRTREDRAISAWH